MRGFFVLAAKKLAWGSIFLMLKQETLVFDSAFLAGGDGGFLSHMHCDSGTINCC